MKLLSGPSVDLIFEQPLEELDVRELLLGGLAVADVEGLDDFRPAEIPELGDEPAADLQDRVPSIGKEVGDRTGKQGCL